MKSQDILFALNDINDKFIADASPQKNKTTSPNLIKTVAALAACFSVISVFIFAYSSLKHPPNELPKLEINIDNSGRGYEASRYYDLKYSNDINPWNEQFSSDTLPVYKNLSYNGITLTQKFFSESQIKEKLFKTAEALEEEILSISTQWDEENDGYFYNCVAETKSFTISETGTSTGIIIKDKKISSESENLMSFLKLYPELLIYKNLKTGIRKVFSYNDELLFEQTVAYSESEDLTESIINYNMSSVNFSSVEGICSIVIEHRLDSAEKLGDYPIISLNEAEEKLISGKYITSVPSSFFEAPEINSADIEKAELVYLITPYSDLYMPYYLFYIYLKNTGTKQSADYGHFYVPAIADDYIENYRLWNGAIQ